MNKKGLIVVLTIFLIVPLMVPQGCAQNSTNETLFEDFRLIEFETTTEITINNETLPDGPIDPGQTEDIEATIKFKFERPWFFPKFLLGTKIGNWIIFREGKYNMSVNLSLSVVEQPEWCDIELPEQVIIEDIGTEFKESTIKFNITVNETTEAFLQDNFRIKATFTPEEAWGLKPSEGSKSFTVESNYVPNIMARFYEMNETTTLTFEGGETKKLFLEIKNIGNGETSVGIKLSPDVNLTNSNWNITIWQKEITLRIEESAIVNISVTARDTSDGFNLPSTYFELTPWSSGDQSLVGDLIRVNTPNFVKEEEGNTFEGLLTIILVAAIIIIIVAAIILLILRKMNR